MFVGDRLRELRKSKEMTLEELGTVTNLGKSNIEAYEMGYSQPPDDAKIILARFFSVSVDYLLGITDTPNAYDPPCNCIYLDADFPEPEKIMLQTIVRLLTFYSQKNPRRTQKELNKAISALTESTAGADIKICSHTAPRNTREGRHYTLAALNENTAEGTAGADVTDCSQEKPQKEHSHTPAALNENTAEGTAMADVTDCSQEKTKKEHHYTFAALNENTAEGTAGADVTDCSQEKLKKNTKKNPAEDTEDIMERGRKMLAALREGATRDDFDIYALLAPGYPREEVKEMLYDIGERAQEYIRQKYPQKNFQFTSEEHSQSFPALAESTAGADNDNFSQNKGNNSKAQDLAASAEDPE